MSKKVSKIAILTSGGDAPGMNATIRAVVRTGVYLGLEVYGIMRGYSGMMEDDIFPMGSKTVANIIQRGGTILKSARCREFYTEEGRAQAYANLKKRGIDGLVVIGGDGSFTGAMKLQNEFGLPVIGLPGTIDKDLYGTDFTIGFDTACNTAVQAIDKIRDTADAHDRLFIVEVMGRHAGYIALHSGIATGAETILIPEAATNIEDVIASLSEKEKRKKLVNIIVVAEGDAFGGANEVAKIVRERLPNFDTKVSILGHIQRGGSPTCIDRLVASRMGYHAVEALIAGKSNVMVGIINNEIVYTPLEVAIREKDSIDENWLRIVKILAS
ncbi:6-phosphofructokinase [Arachidicoccus ginsenosidivorans]|jgi:6-phosphofructokinase 1|uniref:ATP-dependent 6-phosphofructokinase n=1 Tax=Arachidicoccus ginsenosidivorans TaxID=496057 RepID=A0A5B8VP29_9BACT|nr:6-phosphofructokinase [Arachidicoccus ginsenosidivorans]QEC72642.1 6-phosphofructokinase [Arachidicoccus ginsenosidivorans]